MAQACRRSALETEALNLAEMAISNFSIAIIVIESVSGRRAAKRRIVANLSIEDAQGRTSTFELDEVIDRGRAADAGLILEDGRASRARPIQGMRVSVLSGI
jgi:hypothetical protein